MAPLYHSGDRVLDRQTGVLVDNLEHRIQRSPLGLVFGPPGGERHPQQFLLLPKPFVFFSQPLLKLPAIHLPKPLGLPLYLLGLLEKFDESGDLGPDDDRHQRFDEIIDCTQGVSPLDREVVALESREEDDGCVPGLFPAPDQLGRLEPVQVGHLDVQQEDGELVAEQPL
ncbi:MAG TPA: hypothetical protein VG122_12130 [Gemmata sp.]|nr:hypothetical protein [Gemmata sp.]